MSCRERLRAHPLALGLGCLLAVGARHVAAAEWSVSPTYSSAVDHDSNRRLEADPSGTESALVTADLRFQRALEDASISIEPRYTLRRFSDASLGNGDDRSLAAQMSRTWERNVLSLTASVFDQSTLTTELLETGIVSADTHQLLLQSGGSWTWVLCERRQLSAQISYSDVSYHGGIAVHTVLPGYRYPTGSFGEQFVLSQTSSVTLSAFGSALSSDTAGNSNHEYGLQVQLDRALSERTHFVGSVGRSERLLAGKSSQGTDISLSLTHNLTRGTVSLTYVRNLVPYGVGFLVQRQQSTLSGTRQLTPYLDATLSFMRIRNDELSVLLNIDRRSYDSASAGLSWRPSETFRVGLDLGALRTQAAGFAGASQDVNEWHSALTLTWTPHPRTQSW